VRLPWLVGDHQPTKAFTLDTQDSIYNDFGQAKSEIARLLKTSNPVKTKNLPILKNTIQLPNDNNLI
jgi:hypothetical protein